MLHSWVPKPTISALHGSIGTRSSLDDCATVLIGAEIRVPPHGGDLPGELRSNVAKTTQKRKPPHNPALFHTRKQNPVPARLPAIKPLRQLGATESTNVV